ncbi:MAG: SEL1-like repeat protein, partial [Planctomycetaceae bacterium]|nr:SEL1-like repeat protein [Planctomycetaceae bacterium]
MNMKLFYVFQYVFVVVMLLIVFPCYGQETSDSTKSQSEISASSDTETLTPLQQYRKLLLEGKYEEVLPIVDAAMSEKAKILVEEDPQKSLEDIRIEYLSFAYAEIYLLLDRNEEALKKFEENISQLSEKYSNKECCSIFTYRLILLSRLNRIDDFINECNNFINRPSPNMVDYFLGYLYGTMGYAVKKDYEKAKQYLSSAKHYFTVAFPNYNENDENLMVYKQYFEMFEIFLTTRLQDKYDLKPVTKPPTIVKSSDGSIEVKTLLSIEIVLKETGEPIAENEIDKMMKKWLEEKVQERQKKLQEDDPFLKEIRSNSTTNEWKISVTLLTPLQQYLKLLKEKKYKECLPLVETVTSENVKKYAEENP